MNTSSLSSALPLRRGADPGRPAGPFEFLQPQSGELEAEARRVARPRLGPRAPLPPAPRARRPRQPLGGRPLRPPLPRGPRPRPFRGLSRWSVDREPHAQAAPNDGLDDAGGGSEYVRWTQDCLNRVMAAGLPVDGVMRAATRSVLRHFQRRERLPVTGIAGPDTQAALRRACTAADRHGKGGAEPAAEVGAPGAAGGAWSGELSLPAAIADPRSAGAGIYTLYRNGQRLYVGKSQDLRRRLQQHLWCLQHLGVGTGRYAVRLTPMRGATPAQLQRVESATIAKWGQRSKGGVLTNLKAREVETELWGEAWS